MLFGLGRREGGDISLGGENRVDDRERVETPRSYNSVSEGENDDMIFFVDQFRCGSYSKVINSLYFIEELNNLPLTRVIHIWRVQVIDVFYTLPFGSVVGDAGSQDAPHH